ncbi:MAG: hypothetical protein ACYCZF_05565 [Anaerolineae bacterium]
MEKELSLYISAASEMEAECELVGRLLAEGQKSIRWRIRCTPLHQDLNPDLPAIVASQFYLILLGTDVTAPMGVEWRAAENSGAAILAFRNQDKTPSPAATYFARNMGITWQDYKTCDEFAIKFERTLLARLIDGTPGYGLDLPTIEDLALRLKTLDKPAPQGEDQRRGAGQGGIILAAR